MTEIVDFFDTNILVAATVPTHIHHRASSVRLGKLSKGSGACGSHSLAEAYATLTRTSRYGYPPEMVAEIIALTSKAYKIVSLTPAEYVRAIEAAALLGIQGPLLYDALLMACARKANARRIFTHNLKDMRRVAPDLASRIVEP